MTPDEPLRQALRDLVRAEGPVAALRFYAEAMKWPILTPDGTCSRVPR